MIQPPIEAPIGNFNSPFWRPLIWLLNWVLSATKGLRTFTRSSAQIVQDYAGVLQSVDANYPAIEGGGFDSGTNTWSANDPNGYPCHPVDGDGVALYYPERADSDPRVVGDKRWSGRFILTCSQDGTTAAAPPSLDSSDLGAEITDGSAKWTVDGWYQQKQGYLGEGVATNKAWPSRDFSTNWLVSGTPISAQDETGFDGVANKAWTITDDDAAGNEGYYISPTIANGSTSAIAVYVKKANSPSSYPGIRAIFLGGTSVDNHFITNHETGTVVHAGGTSTYTVVVDDLGDFWRFNISLTDDTNDNTSLRFYILPAMSMNGTTATSSATGTAVFDQVDIRLNSSFMDSPIITTTGEVTRAATVLSYPSAGVLRSNNLAIQGIVIPQGSGQNLNGFACYASATEKIYLRIHTGVRFYRMNGASSLNIVSPYAHTNGVPFQYQIYLSSTVGMGIRTRSFTGGVWSAWSAWTTNADTTDAVIANTFELGSLDGASQFSANYPMFATKFSTDPKAYCENEWGA